MLPHANDLTTDIFLLVSLAFNGLAGSLLIHFLLQRRREIQASKDAMKKFESAVLKGNYILDLKKRASTIPLSVDGKGD